MVNNLFFLYLKSLDSTQRLAVFLYQITDKSKNLAYYKIFFLKSKWLKIILAQDGEYNNVNL